MIIPAITSLRVEDFPDQKQWIGKLLFPINQFLLSVTKAVNGNIRLGQNIPCQTQSLVFTYGGTSDFPKSFRWNYVDNPVELRVCSAKESDTAIGVIPIWYFSNNMIFISNILKVSSTGVSSLTAGSNYNIVLRAEP